MSSPSYSPLDSSNDSLNSGLSSSLSKLAVSQPSQSCSNETTLDDETDRCNDEHVVKEEPFDKDTFSDISKSRHELEKRSTAPLKRKLSTDNEIKATDDK